MTTPAVTGDFPGGNAVDIRRLGPNRFAFRVDRHGGELGLWFRLRVAGAAGRVLTFDIEEADRLLGWPRFEPMRVVTGRPGRWRRAADPPRVFAEAGIVRFTVRCDCDPAEVAFCYPYGLEALALCRRRWLSDNRTREREIARTPEGRPVYVWEAGAGRRGVWLTGRHHAGETPASFVLEGLLDAMLSEGCAALLPCIALRVCPMIDPDNTARGAYGKYGPPCDPGQDWSPAPRLPQIAALRDYFAAVSDTPWLYLDLHSPEPYGSTFVAGWEAAMGASPEYLAEADAFCRLLHEESRHPLRLDLSRTRGYPTWYGDALNRWSHGYFKQRHGCLSLTLETAYHQPSGGACPTERDYRDFGRAVCRAIRRSLR